MKQNNVLLRLMKEAETDDERQEFMNNLEANNVRMSDFVKNLLVFARSGNLELKCLNVDINVVINNVLTDLQIAIRESNAQIKIGPMPSSIVCDQTQIGRVFQNLIKNAINWRSSHRPLEIEISAVHEYGFWQFTVTDNGLGIPSEVMPTLFTVFRGKKRDSSGVGFGLAICKRIVQNHYGVIGVKSEIDSGTSFTFSVSDNIKL
jgi:signal transduction histidine kinase